MFVCLFTHGFRSLRKRSISPVQGEQGMGNSPATDGWNHDLYPDSTGSKKMKTDGDQTFLVLTYFSCKSKRIVLIFSLFFSSSFSRND